MDVSFASSFAATTFAPTTLTPWPLQALTASPLVLADRLLTLAQDADRAGYRDTASSLVQLVYNVLDGPVS